MRSRSGWKLWRCQLPLYEAECVTCSKVTEYSQPIARRHRTPKCACGGKTKLIISAVKGFADLPDYVSPVTGKLVSGRKQRIDDLKRTDSRPWEGMEQERKEAARRKRYDDERADRQLTEAAHKAYAELPPTARKVLNEGGPIA
jgi:hypothetical protein